MPYLMFLYFFKRTISSIIFIGLIVLILFTLLSLIRLVDELDENYTLSNLLVYMLLQTPLHLSEHLSFIIFLGLVFALMKISSDNELVVFLAVGVKERTVKLMMVCSALCCYFIFNIFFEYAGSKMLIYSYEYEELTRNNTSKSYSGWLNDNDKLIYIGYAKQNIFQDVSRFEFKDNQLHTYSYAQKVIPDGNQNQWEIFKEKQILIKNTSSKNVLNEKNQWNVEVDYSTLIYLFVNPQEISWSGLYVMSKSFFDYNGKILSKYFVELLRRGMDWLKIVALFFLISSLMFTPSRQIQKGKIIFIAIITGIILFAVMDSVNRYILLELKINVLYSKFSLIGLLLCLPFINKTFQKAKLKIISSFRGLNFK